MFDRLESTEQRFDELTAEMATPEVAGDYEKLQALARERASIEDVVRLYRAWRDTSKALDEARAMLFGRRCGDGSAREGRGGATGGAAA